MNTFEEFKLELPNYYLNKYKISNYLNKISPLTVKCKIHKTSNILNKAFYAIKGCHGCKKCTQENKANAGPKISKAIRKNIRSQLINKYPNYVFPKGKLYVSERIKIICNKNHTFFDTASNQLNKKYGCRKCANVIVNNNKMLSREEFLERIAFRQDKEVGDYLGAKKPIWYRCKDCDCKSGNVAVARSLFKANTCPAKSVDNKYKNKSYASQHFKFKTIKLNGKNYRYQGYEHFALKYLVKNKIKIRQRITPVKYRVQGIIKYYIPDIYLPKTNTIIEVKSPYTLGAKKNNKEKFNIIKKKYKACIKQGFNMEIWVYNRKGEKIPMPKNWLYFTAKTLRQYYKDRNMFTY